MVVTNLQKFIRSSQRIILPKERRKYINSQSGFSYPTDRKEYNMGMCKPNGKTSKWDIIYDFAIEYRQTNSRKRKSEILKAVINLYGYHEKYVIALMKTVKSPEERMREKMDKIAFKYKGGCQQYLDNTVDCLTKIYEASDFQNSKSLVSNMTMWIDKAVQFNWFDEYPKLRFDEVTQKQLKKMSHGTIDKYLRSYRKKHGLQGIATTKPGSLLRNSLDVRKASDEMEQKPGYLEGDTVAHCGNTLVGEWISSLTNTDVHIGWSENVAMMNKSSESVKKALFEIEVRIPYPIEGYDFDCGSEFINHNIVEMIQNRNLYLTRSRPHHSNDGAHVEQKNNDIVRRNMNYYRFNTQEECDLMNEIYLLNHYKYNFFTPTRKVKEVIEEKDKAGRRKRIYDSPKTPLERLFDSGILSKTDEAALRKERDELDPRELTRKMNVLRKKLYKLGASKPESQDKFAPAHRGKRGAII